ncbi:hypothetical protein PUN28_009510 [Cardiocondyla obscurior]|uniref:Uncharacterized protein n=1 Tax=Cardiocondyla obscurior TaxID=286306 RepID=A0AAW2FUM1_9HYME
MKFKNFRRKGVCSVINGHREIFATESFHFVSDPVLSAFFFLPRSTPRKRGISCYSRALLEVNISSPISDSYRIETRTRTLMARPEELRAYFTRPSYISPQKIYAMIYMNTNFRKAFNTSRCRIMQNRFVDTDCTTVGIKRLSHVYGLVCRKTWIFETTAIK